MRVIVLTTSFNHGGAEKHAFLLADYFRNVRKYPTEFWVFKEGDGTIREMCEKTGIPTRIIGIPGRFGRFQHPFQARKEARKFAAFNPDVIVSFNRRANVYAGLVNPFTSARIHVWSQQTVFDLDTLDMVERKAIRSATCYISNSLHASRYLVENAGVDSARVHHVKNGYRPKPHDGGGTSTWREKLGIEKGAFCAVKLAHHRHPKDHMTVLEAWKAVVDESGKSGKKPVLILAGKLTERSNDFASFCVDTGIFPHVRFPGIIKETDDLLAECDLSVMSSEFEGMPNAIIEAMAVGLPVVANQIDGNKEALGPTNASNLFPSGDSEALASLVVKYMLDDELRNATGKKNRLYAQAEYSQAKMGDDTDRILQLYLQKSE